MANYTNSYTSPTTKPLFRGTQIVWYIVGIIEGLLAFRFVLKLLGANSSAWFTQFIYGVTRPLAEPFLNVFRVTRVEGVTFEWTTLLAMVVYALLASAIVNIFLMSKTVSTPEAARGLHDQERGVHR